MASNRQPFVPSAAAIRRACQRIQAGWNKRERERRAPYLRPQAWNIPQVEHLDLPPGEEIGRDWP